MDVSEVGRCLATLRTKLRARSSSTRPPRELITLGRRSQSVTALHRCGTDAQGGDVSAGPRRGRGEAKAEVAASRTGGTPRRTSGAFLVLLFTSPLFRCFPRRVPRPAAAATTAWPPDDPAAGRRSVSGRYPPAPPPARSAPPPPSIAGVLRPVPTRASRSQRASTVRSPRPLGGAKQPLRGVVEIWRRARQEQTVRHDGGLHFKRWGRHTSPVHPSFLSSPTPVAENSTPDNGGRGRFAETSEARILHAAVHGDMETGCSPVHCRCAWRRGDVARLCALPPCMEA
eukprot:363396-Chlamydomonas_euryale.AAC.6